MWNESKLQYTVTFFITIFIFSNMKINTESKQVKAKNSFEQRVPAEMRAYWYYVKHTRLGKFKDADLFDFCSYPYKIRIKRYQGIYDDKLYQTEEERILKLEIRKRTDKGAAADWSIRYEYQPDDGIPPYYETGYLAFDSQKRKLFIPKGVSEEINYTRVECGTKDFRW